MARVFRVALLLIGLVLAVLPVQAANRVVAIGDSWGALLPPAMDTQFDLHGHGDYDVLNIAIPGSTANSYATNMAGILDTTVATIAVLPEIQFVFISIGGNDLVGQYPSLGSGVFAQVEADLRTVIDRILAVRPDVEILMAGYDVLKFDKSDFCLVLAYTQFGKVLPWEVTPLFLELGARQSAIDASYAKVTYVNLWGTGQGSPGSPNLLAWSPSSYVATPDEDCVHLSDAGYTQFAAQIYNSYFAPRLAPKCGGVVTEEGVPAGPTALAPLLLPLAAAAFLRLRRPARRVTVLPS